MELLLPNISLYILFMEKTIYSILRTGLLKVCGQHHSPNSVLLSLCPLWAVWTPQIRRRQRVMTLMWRWMTPWRAKWTVSCHLQQTNRKLLHWRWRLGLPSYHWHLSITFSWLLKDTLWLLHITSYCTGFIHCRSTRQLNTLINWKQRETLCWASAIIHRSSSRTGLSLRAEIWR